MSVEEGRPAPDLTLTSDTGEAETFSSLKGALVEAELKKTEAGLVVEKRGLVRSQRARCVVDPK